MSERSAEKAGPIPVGLQADGVLWAINRVLFHPRGFALGYDVATVAEQDERPLLRVVWCYADSMSEDGYMAAFEALLQRARTSVGADQ